MSKRYLLRRPDECTEGVLFQMSNDSNSIFVGPDGFPEIVFSPQGSILRDLLNVACNMRDRAEKSEAKSLRDHIREKLGKREWEESGGMVPASQMQVGLRIVTVFHVNLSFVVMGVNKRGHAEVQSEGNGAATLDAAKSAALDALADILAKEIEGP